MNNTTARRLLEQEEKRWSETRDGFLADHLSDMTESEWVGEVGTVGQHPADLASETLEREIEIGLLDEATIMLAEIAAARRRLDEGRYGMCERCHRRIPAARLEAVPATRFCVAHEQQAERAARQEIDITGP